MRHKSVKNLRDEDRRCWGRREGRAVGVWVQGPPGAAQHHQHNHRGMRRNHLHWIQTAGVKCVPADKSADCEVSHYQLLDTCGCWFVLVGCRHVSDVWKWNFSVKASYSRCFQYHIYIDIDIQFFGVTWGEDQPWQLLSLVIMLWVYCTLSRNSKHHQTSLTCVLLLVVVTHSFLAASSSTLSLIYPEGVLISILCEKVTDGIIMIGHWLSKTARTSRLQLHPTQ